MIENYSLPIWMLKNGIKNEKNQPLEFDDHFFLFDILADTSKKQVIKKAAQVGMSVAYNLKAFYLADKMGLSLIYTMPSDSDVQEFSKTKTDKIFQANEVIRKRIKLDNVELKQIGDNFIYFKGTRSKAAPISTTADALFHDELDRSDLEIIKVYGSRTSFSQYKGEFLFSNPSTTGIGIDRAWKNSDKKEWFIACLKCGESQPLTWEDNVNEIQGIYVCRQCNKELSKAERKKGEWKATGEGEYSGYHISQMMASWLTAQDLIKEREKRGIEYFMNFVLGEPYSVGDVPNFRQVITDCWTPTPQDQEPFFMGIDVGKQKHWVLGSYHGIFKIGVCESRQELESVIKRYNPIVVMDSGPERTWAEEFKKQFPKLYLCFYRHDKNIAKMVQWGAEKGTYEDAKNAGYVWIDRNRVIDQVVYDMSRGEILFSLTREDLERVIEHWEAMRRVEEPVKSLRDQRYIWENVGPNHFASSLWFYWLARQRGIGKLEVMGDIQPKRDIIEMTSQGPRMRDLREIMEEKMIL